MLRGNVALGLHTPDPPETVEAYIIRSAEIELRNLRRRLGSDAEWNARLAARPGPVRTGPPAWFPGRPRGRPRRWLRDYYVNKAIDRLRADGESVKAAASHVANLLLDGPWPPSLPEFEDLFPSTDPRDPDLRRKVAENLRNAYQQRRLG
jgi:hypothetical protein